MTEAPRLSLILCTAATHRRVAEIGRLLDSLAAQSFTDFEVVVVDQNDGFDLAALLAPHAGRLRLVHVRSALGLSRARNVGLRHARGALCGFPDDDCWYPEDLLARVAAAFDDPALDGLHGKGADAEGRDMARFDAEPGPISKLDVLERSVSCALFYRTEAVSGIGGFDEGLGLGSGTEWVGCEDYDLPIRLIAAGRRLRYDPTLVVHHPCPTLVYDRDSIRRAAAQSPSFGRILALHRYPAWFVAARVARPLGGALVSLAQGRTMKSRYHLASFLGRARGVLRSLG